MTITTTMEDWNPARTMVSPQLHRGRLPNPQPILAYILQLLAETLRPCAVRAELHTTGMEGTLPSLPSLRESTNKPSCGNLL